MLRRTLATVGLSSLLLLLGSAPAATQRAATAPGAGRKSLPPQWWTRTPAIARVAFRPRGNQPAFPLKSLPELEAALNRIRQHGVTAIEIFAPAEGGRSFNGLDTINRYRVEPAAGTMEDFRRLVRLAHSKGMAVITFDNFGYSSVEAVEFLKACEDVRAGRQTREAGFFLWADSASAPPPVSAPGNTYFFVRPTHLPGAEPGTFYNSERNEFWQYSERAGKFYWTKWAGRDRAGNPVRLPQYNWASPAFQEEVEKMIRFWMDTGIDGMVIDAVNWYVHHTWEIGKRRMTGVIAGYGNTYIQPEGAGAFRDDPVAWITEGGYNSVQDYGLGIWWEKGTDVIGNAIASGDPRPIERALRDYHDRVVAAGGILYFQPSRQTDVGKRRLAVATLAATGTLIQFEDLSQQTPDPEITWLLATKAAHPALHQLSTRRKLPTAADDKHYAFLRTSADGAERLLVVLNFQPTDQAVTVDMSGVSCKTLTDLKSGQRLSRPPFLKMSLPPFGYRFYLVE